MQSKLTVTTLDSLDAFEQNADRWNQLWETSTAYEATSRSEGVALWVRTYGDPTDFRAIIVESPTGELLAGIALMVNSIRGLKKLTLPVNDWTSCGELLVSASVENSDDVVGLIVDQLQLEGDVLELDRIQFEAPHWRCLADQLEQREQTLETSRVKRVGLIDIGSDWERYFQALSGNHRSAVRRSEKKVRKSGEVQLLRLLNPEDETLHQRMSQAFEIEHRSWKGPAGTSILAAGMEEYFLQEATNARDCGMLDLWFLLLDDQPIAFEYCHLVKGYCHSYKIGYDEKFKAFGPGRLLRKMQLEYLTDQGDQDVKVLDTMGLLCQTKAKWVTRDYQTGRLTASLSMAGRLMVKGQQVLRRIKNRVRPQQNEQAEIKLGGASFSIAENQPNASTLPYQSLTPLPSVESSPVVGN